MPDATINGISMHYDVIGPEDGAPLLLCNSLASTHRMWDWQIDAFAAQYRVIRYDRRGHGRTEVTAPPYTVELLADDALALLDHLGIERAHFCGLSLGGMTGQMLGSRNPERIGKLILCDTGSYMQPKEMWDGRIETVRASGMEAVADATIDRWLTKPFQAQDPGATAKIREMIVTTPVEGFVGCCMAIRDMDQRESRKSITAPTLVICGADDASTTPEMAWDIAEAVPGAKCTILPEAAHFSNAEQPALFNKAVLDFLAE